ncbi:MAG: DUF4130 domain-containing protein [Sphingobium sp.]|nr:DUF4130 domain-containing protein [Sphingobium sp.]
MIYAVSLPDRGVFEAWRQAARNAISHDIAPDQIDWAGKEGLFPACPLPDAGSAPAAVFTVPQAFLRLAGSVIWHNAPERFALLYQALWRLSRREGNPISPADALGRRLNLMAKAVGRDIHKMHAFVRFREVPGHGDRRSFAAWFEPEHHTLEPGSRFFVKRFADMDWMIATPRLTACYEAGKLRFGPGGPQPDLPEDASEALWATYFANIFNPARVKLNAMQSEMPKKYWKNLPETRLIPDMLKDAEARVERMRAAGTSIARPGAAAISTRYRATMPKPVERPATMEEARLAVRHCHQCGLCEAATQAIWGEGNSKAALMIVAGQPEDKDDLSGRPFTGPDGQMVRDMLTEAAIDPAQIWMTHAVKHYKFTPQGKNRVPVAPDRDEILACRQWLALELAFVQPRIILALGEGAAFSLTGDDGPLSLRRGRTEKGLLGTPVLLSWHPADIAQMAGAARQKQARQELLADLLQCISFYQASLPA